MAAAFALDPDTALMLRVSKGDTPSFSLLLERHRVSVVNHLHRLVRNHAIAEELAQDVFIRVYRSRGNYRPDAKFTTWLFRITMNIALNWRRDTRREAGFVRLDREVHGSRKLQLTDWEPRADELLMRGQREREIRAAIETLPPKQLAAVLMHKYEGLDYAQIAKVLDCSIPALKSLLFRAYETLRRRLAHLAPLCETEPATRKTAAAL
ncbi:MAG TPA: RNA polymerase sigma factor [Bryobacteraceae bacterium]|jgi:RNA polymerase sigma-70 factor (ECF subfamily)|nr:RNA polymerase sigma factor [Bryobacteraceae bacterium]